MREIFWRARFVNHDSSAVHRATRRRRDFSLAGISRQLLASVHGFHRRTDVVCRHGPNIDIDANIDTYIDTRDTDT